ncbi:MAG: flippase-like domain-containing protein [Nitrospirae bacterium]|nr:flippase-like domain-containing protein [Nitrospirota bacterium]
MDIQVKKKLLWATSISAILMAFLLLKVDWEHFTLIAGRMNIKKLVAAFTVFLLGNLVRAFRFHKLDHTDNKLTHWWYINAFYNFITATLPGGSGEAATAYVLKQFSKFNIIGALRILFLSRLMDIFALSALFFIAAVIMPGNASYREASMWLSGAMFLISSITLLPSSEQFVMRLLQKMPGRGVLITRVREKLSELTKILEEQRGNLSFRITLFQSLLMWTGSIVLLHLVLLACGVDFTLFQSAYCFGVYAVFQIIPLQGIAGIGTQAAWFSLALSAAGYRAGDAIALGLVLHGIFYLFIASMGIFSLLAWLKGRRKE